VHLLMTPSRNFFGSSISETFSLRARRLWKYWSQRPYIFVLYYLSAICHIGLSRRHAADIAAADRIRIRIRIRFECKSFVVRPRQQRAAGMLVRCEVQQ
jgi:hypothetical protein